MTKLALLLSACLLGVAACSSGRVPDDAQLATLLRAERASHEVLALPIYPELQPQEVEYVAETLRKIAG